MAGFPGLCRDGDGTRRLDPALRDDTLARIAELGSRSLLVLPQRGELPPGAFEGLGDAAARHGLTLTFLPIPDFGIPDAGAMARWRGLSPDLHSRIAIDGAAAVCCQAGAGRSGLIATLVLIEQGIDAAKALSEVRRHHPQAVETAGQERWLMDRRPQL